MNEDYIFGIQPIIEALNSNKTIDKILVQSGLQGVNYSKLMSQLKQKGIEPKYVPIDKLNKLTRENHQGVIAFLSPIKPLTVSELKSQASTENPVFLALDGITDVRNFGAIIRTAECCGIQGIILGTQNAAPINATAVKTSAGAVYNIPIAKTNNLLHALHNLQEEGFLIACATEKTEKIIYDLSFNEPMVIVLGSEEKGISREILKMADIKFKLPIIGKTGSLNVSVACGAILYEIVRQRAIEEK